MFVCTPAQFLSIKHTLDDKILDWSGVKSIADEKIKCDSITNFFGMDKIHCGKGRKCWLPTVSPYPEMFLKGFSLVVI